jgi:hypothetical protein
VKSAESWAVFGVKSAESWAVFGVKSAESWAVFGVKSAESWAVFGVKSAQRKKKNQQQPQRGSQNRNSLGFGNLTDLGSAIGIWIIFAAIVKRRLPEIVKLRSAKPGNLAKLLQFGEIVAGCKVNISLQKVAAWGDVGVTLGNFGELT